MSFNTKTILLASLVGSKVAESIPRFTMVQSEMQKHVLPPIPFLPQTNEIDVPARQSVKMNAQIWQADAPNISGQFFPLSFRRKTDGLTNTEQWYTFPYEPLISISGKNNIVKRNVAKANGFVGTVKERFSQDDYTVTITGSLIGMQLTGTYDECFPRRDFERLRDYCICPGGIEIQCEPLQLLGINSLVVEEFSFPFTKGENVQAYELHCLSDFTSELLLEIE